MSIKPIIWIGSSKRDLLALPEIVKDEMGFALYEAQRGEKSAKVKPFKGFKGASVLEIIERSVGETYRALYTVEFEKVIAVLHVFHKKSKDGIKTPKRLFSIQASVDFRVLLSRFSIPFWGVISTFVYYPPKWNRKPAKIIPKIDEALV